MKQNRVDRIMAALKKMGLHQMLIVDPMSIYYLTGVYVSPFERFYGLYLREDGHFPEQIIYSTSGSGY